MEANNEFADNFTYLRGYRDATKSNPPAEITDESKAYIYELGYADGGGEIPIVLGIEYNRQSQMASEMLKKQTKHPYLACGES